jgi:hypothetical protein
MLMLRGDDEFSFDELMAIWGYRGRRGVYRVKGARSADLWLSHSKKRPISSYWQSLHRRYACFVLQAPIGSFGVWLDYHRRRVFGR